MPGWQLKIKLVQFKCGKCLKMINDVSNDIQHTQSEFMKYLVSFLVERIVHCLETTGESNPSTSSVICLCLDFEFV